MSEFGMTLCVFIVIVIIRIINMWIKRAKFKRNADLVIGTVEHIGTVQTESVGSMFECIVSYEYNKNQYKLDLATNKYKEGKKVKLYVDRNNPDMYIVKNVNYIGSLIVIAIMYLLIKADISGSATQMAISIAIAFGAVSILMIINSIRSKENTTFRLLAIVSVISTIILVVMYNHMVELIQAGKWIER